MKIDQYSLKARVYPALIVVLPIFFFFFFYITEFAVYYHYITAFISIFLLSYLLSHLGRDAGKSKESKLYELWGGKPTTQILRYSNSELDRLTKERYYRILQEKIKGLNIPTLDEEKQNAVNSDEIYNSCATYLISKTRNTNKYALLFNENINYGFRRNLWGMKPLGLCILLFCFLIHLIIATDFFSSISFTPTIDLYLYIAFAFILCFWLFVVRPNWIKNVAFEYAKRLYETLENDN
jgi:hypothetical protein